MPILFTLKNKDRLPVAQSSHRGVVFERYLYEGTTEIRVRIPHDARIGNEQRAGIDRAISQLARAISGPTR